MTYRKWIGWIPGISILIGGECAVGHDHTPLIRSHPHAHPDSHQVRRDPEGKTNSPAPLACGGGWIRFGTPYFISDDLAGPVISMAPPWIQFVPQAATSAVNATALGGPMPSSDPPHPAPGNPKVRRVDPEKGVRFVTLGDRLFRAKNFQKACERYVQAVRADPNAAPQRVRLSQVALVRGRFTEAATLLREATEAEPGWLTRASDIQSIYAEPADFARQIARLESRVLIEPGDRDAWLVLGAELYLSGQTRRASDVFVRLTDRKPDATLSAFLDAAEPGRGVARP